MRRVVAAAIASLLAACAFGFLPAVALAKSAQPTVGVIQTLRTYTSREGNGTLVLRCSQLSKPTGSSGQCAVISATGDYASLSRTGTIIAFDPTVVTDTVVFGS